MNYVSKRIKEIRKQQNITQEQLAEILCTNRIRISKIENAKTDLTFNEAIVICQHFNISIESFFESTNLSSSEFLLISKRYINNNSITTNERRDTLKRIHISFEEKCFDDLSVLNVTDNNICNNKLSKSNKIDIDKFNR